MGEVVVRLLMCQLLADILEGKEHLRCEQRYPDASHPWASTRIIASLYRVGRRVTRRGRGGAGNGRLSSQSAYLRWYPHTWVNSSSIMVFSARLACR